MTIAEAVCCRRSRLQAELGGKLGKHSSPRQPRRSTTVRVCRLLGLAQKASTLDKPLTEVLARAGHPRRLIVLIPCHDGEAEIGNTVRGVLQQSLRPDRVIVVADNCSDDTEAVALLAGAEVFTTIDNRLKKAGALNQALRTIMPECSPRDVIAGFDDDTSPNSMFLENALRWIDRGYEAVGATFHGRDGGRILGLMQRAEFARFARYQHRKQEHVDVLSGTGWAYTVERFEQCGCRQGRWASLRRSKSRRGF